MDDRRVNLLARLHHYRRLLLVLIVRGTPLPWPWKRWIIWAISPRFALGVAAVLFGAEGRVLALCSAYSGHWQLPGGGVHYGESFEQAMRREAREELGFEPRELRMVALVSDSSGRGLHAIFRGECPEQPISLSEEHTDWRFLEVAGLPPFFRGCVAAAQRSAGASLTLGRIDYPD